MVSSQLACVLAWPLPFRVGDGVELPVYKSEGGFKSCESLGCLTQAPVYVVAVLLQHPAWHMFQPAVVRQVAQRLRSLPSILFQFTPSGALGVPSVPRPLRI